MDRTTPSVSENSSEILASWNLPGVRKQIRLAMSWYLDELSSIRHDALIDAIAFVVDAGNVAISTAWAYEADIENIVGQHGTEHGYDAWQICNPAEYPNWSPDFQSFPELESELSRLSATTEADYEKFGEPYLLHGWSERLDNTLSEFLIEAINDSALLIQTLPLTEDVLIYVHRHDAGDLENYFTLKRTISKSGFSKRLAAYEAWILAASDSGLKSPH